MEVKILLIDNYDSFTYNLAQYLWELGFDTTVKRNDEMSLEEIKKLDPTHIIISPGPGTPQDSGVSMDILAEMHYSKPIFGVCLGHQCIGQFFGASVQKAPIPKHGKTSLIEHDEQWIFKSLPNPLRATRYHSLIVSEASIDANKLMVTAKSKDDSLVMGLKHKHLPIFGVQFHPESIMTEHGHQMLKNFILGSS